MQHASTNPPPLRQFNPTVPLAVEKIVMKTLEKEPEDRFQSASDLIIALDESNLVPLSLNWEEATSDARPSVHIADQPTKHDEELSDEEKNRSWYLWSGKVEGKLICKRAATEQIRESLSQSAFTLEQLVSRSPRGPYRPLREFIEFRMPTAPDTAQPPGRRWPGWIVFVGFTLFCVTFMFLLWWLMPLPKK